MAIGQVNEFFFEKNVKSIEIIYFKKFLRFNPKQKNRNEKIKSKTQK